MSKPNWMFPALVIAGIAIVLWDFTRLFSGWVVASQRDAGAITVFFFFCGVLPIIGLVACCLRRKWGAWILLASPWVATLGLLGIHDWLLFIVLFVLPTSVLGLMFQRLLAGNSAEAAQ